MRNSRWRAYTRNEGPLPAATGALMNGIVSRNAERVKKMSTPDQPLANSQESGDGRVSVPPPRAWAWSNTTMSAAIPRSPVNAGQRCGGATADSDARAASNVADDFELSFRRRPFLLIGGVCHERGVKNKKTPLGGLFIFGGEGGIRTHGRLTPTPDFESGTFDHSATSPVRVGR